MVKRMMYQFWLTFTQEEEKVNHHKVFTQIILKLQKEHSNTIVQEKFKD